MGESLGIENVSGHRHSFPVSPQGRFTIAAKHHISIAEIYETELVDVEKVSWYQAGYTGSLVFPFPPTMMLRIGGGVPAGCLQKAGAAPHCPPLQLSRSVSPGHRPL